AVDGPQGHPRQRAGAGLLRVRDDRAVPRGLPRSDDVPRAGRAEGRAARARRRGDLFGQRRVVVHHGRAAAGGRRAADDVGAVAWTATQLAARGPGITPAMRPSVTSPGPGRTAPSSAPPAIRATTTSTSFASKTTRR